MLAPIWLCKADKRQAAGGRRQAAGGRRQAAGSVCIIYQEQF